MSDNVPLFKSAVYLEYVEFLKTTKWYAHADQMDSGELAYHALGIAGEGGELVDLVKKIVRDHGYNKPLKELSPELLQRLDDELGDVMWYFTQLCILMGRSHDAIMALNMHKLRAREANDGAGRQHVE